MIKRYYFFFPSYTRWPVSDIAYFDYVQAYTRKGGVYTYAVMLLKSSSSRVMVASNVPVIEWVQKMNAVIGATPPVVMDPTQQQVQQLQLQVQALQMQIQQGAPPPITGPPPPYFAPSNPDPNAGFPVAPGPTPSYLQSFPGSTNPPPSNPQSSTGVDPGWNNLLFTNANPNTQ